MKEYKYKVIAYRQQERAPVQVAFVAPSAELLEWAGIPRRSDELLTGYQRFRDDERVRKEIVPFFQDPRNCSPTAIIVALRSDSGAGGCSLSVHDVKPGEAIDAELTITLDEEVLATDRVFEAARAYVQERIDKQTPNGANGEKIDDGADEADEDLGEEDEEGEEIGDVHLGNVTLAKVKEVLDDRANWSNKDFRAAMSDFVKPAALIDGQHRVTAAAKIGTRGIPFMVCGLFDAPWDEQVFQFTVVNIKPKRIPASTITSIAALSLTRSEQDQVQGRLQQAGVRVSEVTVMSLVSYDDRSPFVNMVDSGQGAKQKKEQLLGYGSIKRIANVWYGAQRNSLTQIVRQAYDVNNILKSREKWRHEQAWFDFFCAFWSEIRGHYPATLWKKGEGNKFFVGAQLWALQEALLEEADGQLPKVWSVPEGITTVEDRLEHLRQQLIDLVRQTIVYFPAEMWTVEWAKSSQDTNAGRADLLVLFKKFIDSGKKRGAVWRGWRNDPWFSAT